MPADPGVGLGFVILVSILLVLPAAPAIRSGSTGTPLAVGAAPLDPSHVGPPIGRTHDPRGGADAVPAGGSTWVQISSPGSIPAGRFEAGIAFDPTGNFTVLFGGATSTRMAPFNDTWEFSNRTWTNVTSTAGAAPSERQLALLVSDPADGYLLLYGGWVRTGANSSVTLADTWKFENQAWTNITSTVGFGPSPRYFASMAYDPVVRGVILFGGFNAVTSRPLNETWEFHNGRWQNISVSSGPRTPSARDEQSMAFDQGDGYLVLYGGYNQTSVSVDNDTWRFSGGVWSQLFPSSNPGPLRAAFFSAGVQGGRFPVLFGGDSSAALGGSNATWEIRGAEWFDLTGQVGLSPSPRAFGGLAWDSSRNFAVLFGGGLLVGSVATAYNDTWVLSASPSVILAANPSAVDVGQVISLDAFLTGGTLPVTYNWTGLPPECSASNTPILRCSPAVVQNLSIGVLVSDWLGLTAASAALVSVWPTPAVSITARPTGGSAPLMVSFAAHPSGGSPPFHIDWQFGDGLVASNSPTSHRFISAGHFNVSTWANDSNGGSSTATLEVDVGAALTTLLQVAPASAILDVGQTLSLVSTETGGTRPYAYAWSGLPPGCPPLNASNMTCSPTQSGSFAAKLIVTDAQGSTASSTSVVTIHGRLAINASGLALVPCGPSAVNYTAIVTGGSWPYVIHWTFGPGDTPVGPTQQRQYPQPGRQVSPVSVTDAAHAYANESVEVNLPACQPGPATFAGLTALGWVVIAAVVALIAFLTILARYRRRPPRPTSSGVEDLTDADDWIR